MANYLYQRIIKTLHNAPSPLSLLACKILKGKKKLKDAFVSAVMFRDYMSEKKFE